MRLLVVVLASLLLVTIVAVGQAPAPAPSAAGPLKIGVVDTQRVLGESEQGKLLQKELETKFAPRQKELQAGAAEIEKLQADFQQKQASMNDAERQRRGMEIQQKQKRLERLNEDVTAEFNATRDEGVGRLARRVNDVVQKYGADRQYSLLLDAAGSGALYVGKGTDVTAEILAAFNQANPVK